MPACDSPAAGADRRNSCSHEIRVFESCGQVYCFLCTLARSITRGYVVVPVVRLAPRALSALPCQHSQLYSPVSWLKKVQTKLCGLVFIDSQQKCIDFCKYASYLPAKLEAGACSPLSAPAAVVGRQLQHRGQCSQQCDHRRRDQRSWSKPKSRRRQRRPRLAAPPYS